MKKIFILPVILLVMLFLSGCSKINKIDDLNKINKIENNTATEINKTELPKKYIITKGSILKDIGREDTNFSVYSLDGKLINKINLPENAVNHGGFAESGNVFGNKIYYLSGTDDLTSISEIDPITSNITNFDFIKAENTNKGNVLSAIVGWTVSSDNKKIAWIDTDGILNVANIDGSDEFNYKLANSTHRIIIPSLEFSKDNSNIYVWDDESSNIRSINLNNKTENILVNVMNGRYFILSKDGNYLAYSDMYELFGIYDLKNNKNNIIKDAPECSNPLYFSTNKNGLYFYEQCPGPFGENYQDYYVNNDGTNITKLNTNISSSAVDFISDNFIITRCGERVGATCYKDLSKNPITENKISDEWYIGNINY